MVDLKKLDSTISELEENAQKILRINEILDDVGKILSETKVTKKQLEEISQQLEEVLKESKSVILGSKELHKMLQVYCDDSKNSFERFKSEVNTMLFGMKNENHQLYMSFESKIYTKFEQFKNEVIIENRKGLDDRLSGYEKMLNQQKIAVLSMLAVTLVASIAAIVLQLM